MIYSYEIEQHLLSGIIQHPDTFFEISPFISEKDFYSESSLINKSLFFILKSSLNNGEVLDEILISEKIKSLGISFEEGIDCLEYIQGLVMRRMSKDSVMESAKELKKITIRRELFFTGLDIQKEMKKKANASYQEIIDSADFIYHKNIDIYESGDSLPSNIYDDMEELVEERGNYPVSNYGQEGPHRRLHEQ